MIPNNRILIIDDDQGIRDTYKQILETPNKNRVLAAGEELFADIPTKKTPLNTPDYKLTLAASGEEGLKLAKEAIEKGCPFAAAFIDMKMPGINGSETAKELWTLEPRINIAIVTAYSEYTPEDIVQKTGRDDIFYLRKPFNQEEIRQFARAFVTKWQLEYEKGELTRELEESNTFLAELNNSLEEKVKEQTNMLLQSEKMTSIGIMASGVAHEINNPIAYIKGNMSAIKRYCSAILRLFDQYQNLEGAVKKNDPESINRLLNDIFVTKDEEQIDFIMNDILSLIDESYEGTLRVESIVKDLKAFSRKDDLEYAEVNLNESLDTTLNIIWNELKYKAIVKKDYGELPLVKCFPGKVSQVFMNILINAGQAIEEKGEINISTMFRKGGRRAADETVEVRISDTGCGIPKDKLANIFDPFFTTKPVGEGTGLGLSVCYDIIKAHGGTIKVESDLGFGTTFIINLPLNAVD